MTRRRGRRVAIGLTAGALAALGTWCLVRPSGALHRVPPILSVAVVPVEEDVPLQRPPQRRAEPTARAEALDADRAPGADLQPAEIRRSVSALGILVADEQGIPVANAHIDFVPEVVQPQLATALTHLGLEPVLAVPRVRTRQDGRVQVELDDGLARDALDLIARAGSTLPLFFSALSVRVRASAAGFFDQELVFSAAELLTDPSKVLRKEITLPRGRLLKGTVVDAHTRAPIAGAWIQVETHDESGSSRLATGRSDGEGRFAQAFGGSPPTRMRAGFGGLPVAEEKLLFLVSAPAYALRECWVWPADSEQVIELEPGLPIAIQLVHAATGQPLDPGVGSSEARITEVTRTMNGPGPTHQRGSQEIGPEGRLTCWIPGDSLPSHFILRVEGFDAALLPGAEIDLGGVNQVGLHPRWLVEATFLDREGHPIEGGILGWGPSGLSSQWALEYGDTERCMQKSSSSVAGGGRVVFDTGERNGLTGWLMFRHLQGMNPDVAEPMLPCQTKAKLVLRTLKHEERELDAITLLRANGEEERVPLPWTVVTPETAQADAVEIRLRLD